MVKKKAQRTDSSPGVVIYSSRVWSRFLDKDDVKLLYNNGPNHSLYRNIVYGIEPEPEPEPEGIIILPRNNSYKYYRLLITSIIPDSGYPREDHFLFYHLLWI